MGDKTILYILIESLQEICHLEDLGVREDSKLYLKATQWRLWTGFV